ncbi:unnamed protein product [Coregonus sp. 'balchen']|nr:unnamed protein product [Coregonus sp. 'balchen']
MKLLNKDKMSSLNTHSIFETETTSIMAFVVETAVVEISQLFLDKESIVATNPSNLREKKQLGTIMHLLTKEAVRKICRLFLEVSAALQNENEKLKIKVEQMDKDLKGMVEGREEPKRPTHILHNGKIFKIKPVDLPMMPVNNVKTNTVASALLSIGDVSQVNTVIVREEVMRRLTVNRQRLIFFSLWEPQVD